jgi:hypothetical protein
MERHGVIESSSVYNHRALARVLGVRDVHDLFRQGLPFAKIERQYLISGHHFNVWVRRNSKTWEELYPNAREGPAP